MCEIDITRPDLMGWEQKEAAALELERLAAQEEAMGFRSKASLRRGYAAALKALAWEECAMDVPAEVET